MALRVLGRTGFAGISQQRNNYLRHNGLKQVVPKFSNTRTFATEQKVSLPDLKYEYSALEPYISGQIMALHHGKHHQTYVNAYNATLDKLEEAEKNKDLAQQINLQGALRFNGGGHVNHSIFWENLIPAKDYKDPSGELAKAIQRDFKSLENLQQAVNTAAASIQGSGWGWIGYNKNTDKLVVTTTANQDPVITQGLVPLLGIDMWEHAFYLQYQNVKPDYLKNIWHVINWADVAQRYEKARK